MPPTPEARQLAPNYMHSEDIKNYAEQFQDLIKENRIPENTRILNIHQIFDSGWNYVGAWFTCDSKNPSVMFWVLMDDDWEVHAISYDTPITMYRFIYYRIIRSTVINYRAYLVMGNMGKESKWSLLSAGDLDISKFIEF